MKSVHRDFQVFVKPIGARCNLACEYCYYLKTVERVKTAGHARMTDNILERYIQQHINASSGEVINFSWHGGEPTLLGVEYFQKITTLQRKYCPANRQITNTIQTNGTLLDENWCRFFADEGFTVGLSLDGPAEFHDHFRKTQGNAPTHAKTLRGYELLTRFQVPVDVLCVVNSINVKQPTHLYRYFKSIDAKYIGLLPLVEPLSLDTLSVSDATIDAEDWGNFLCDIFDVWKGGDIGRVTVQMIEEALQKGIGKEHALCIFKKTCGDVPVIENNGDFYSCDHYVNREYHLGNITTTSLTELLECESQRNFGQAKWKSLPDYCLKCDVLDQCYGECPRNRFILTPDGQVGLNYLCDGYKRFFRHTRPFVEQVAKQAKKRLEINQNTKVGRNDPCPCGSGRKYKKCCMLK